MFKDLLNQVRSSIGDALALALIGADGMPIASVTEDEDIDLEMLGAELLVLMKTIGTNHGEIDPAKLRQFTLRTNRFQLATREVIPGFYLLLVASPQANLGRANYQLKRAGLLLEPELT